MLSSGARPQGRKEVPCRTCQHDSRAHRRVGILTPGKQCEAGNCHCQMYRAH